MGWLIGCILCRSWFYSNNLMQFFFLLLFILTKNSQYKFLNNLIMSCTFITSIQESTSYYYAYLRFYDIHTKIGESSIKLLSSFSYVILDFLYFKFFQGYNVVLTISTLRIIALIIQ